MAGALKKVASRRERPTWQGPSSNIFENDFPESSVSAPRGPTEHSALRRRRDRRFLAAALFFALGIWGLIAWSAGLPLGGEIRSDPRDPDPWRLSNLGELLFKTVPHPSLIAEHAASAADNVPAANFPQQQAIKNPHAPTSLRSAIRTDLQTVGGTPLDWRARYYPAPWTMLSLAMALFYFERASAAHRQLRRQAGKPRIAEHGVNDDPIGLNDGDALGLIAIARTLSQFLRNVETKPTVAIGITGPWGSGKSSLMNLVREDLNDRGVNAVWFNAWHHQKEESLLAALLAAIRAQAVPPVWSLAGMRVRLEIAWCRFRSEIVRNVILVGLIVVALWLVKSYGARLPDLVAGFIGQFDTFLNAEQKKAIADIVTTLLGSGGLVGFAYSAAKVWLLFKPIRAKPSDLLASVADAPKPKAVAQQLEFRETFAREFKMFCTALRRAPHPGLIIFIDDLDRCGSRQTVDVLEAINFVTTAGPCFVVLGFDEAKVKAAVADVYKDTLLDLDERAAGKVDKPRKDQLFRFATNYLEKLVHLIVPVPQSKAKSVEMLLGLTSAPRPSRSERLWRRRRREFGEVTRSVLVATLAAMIVYLAWIGMVPRSTDTSSGAGVHVPLIETGDVSTLLPSILVFCVLLVLVFAALACVPRFFSEPAIDDSQDFRAALKIWVPVIAAKRGTPRAVKRFVNKLRFLAMRVRDVDSEPHAPAATTEPTLLERMRTRLRSALRRMFDRDADTAEPGARIHYLKRFSRWIGFLMTGVIAADGAPSPGPAATPSRTRIDEALLVAFATIDDIREHRLGPAAEAADTGAGQMKQEFDTAVAQFTHQFGRAPDADSTALAAYRVIAGIVEERAGDVEPNAAPPRRPARSRAKPAGQKASPGAGSAVSSA